MSRLRLGLTAAALLALVQAQPNCPGQAPVRKGETINVHVAPHTHDDVGWDETYYQYRTGTGPVAIADNFPANTTAIISGAIAALSNNPKRRFVYVEQAFFTVFIEQADDATKAAARALVAAKQLVFLNGGWCMPDEASPTFVDLLDNVALGHRNIVKNFNVDALPTFGSQLDPFGHSAFMGVLTSPAGGYTGLTWARESADFKMACCKTKSLQRVWTPSPSLGAAKAATFQAIFNDAGYGTPDEVGRCDYNFNAMTCNATWAPKDFASLKSDIEQFRFPNFLSNEILLNFGDDFVYKGEAAFAYVDALIDLLNNDPSKRYNAFYSTAEDYAAATMASVALPHFSGDFMPYNDDAGGGMHNTWSGYFTSRPAFKGFVRESSAYHQTARQLQAITGGVTSADDVANPLFALERAMGVTQHHDSIAGTAHEEVNGDYSLLLEAGRASAFAGIGASLAAATGYAAAPFANCPLANVTLCPALAAATLEPIVAVVHNTLAQAGELGVRLPVALPAGVASWGVLDAAGAPVQAQIVPLSQRDAELRVMYGGAGSPRVAWLCFVAPAVPPAGFSSFFLMPSATPVASTAQSTLTPVVPFGGQDAVLTNGRLTLTVSADTGFLARYADASTGLDLAIAQSFDAYVGFNGSFSLDGTKQASGAYIFRPLDNTPQPVVPGPADVLLVTGPVVSEAQQAYGYVTQATRLWAGAASAELEWTVGPIDDSDGQSHEVVSRLTTPLATAGAWVTDSNCREGQARVRNARPQWANVSTREPVASNYYPVNCGIRISDGATTVAVSPDRSEGGASIADGQLELMVHRRLLFDDGRGVGQALDEPGVDGRGLIVRGRHWLVAAPAGAAPPLYKALHNRATSLPGTSVFFARLGALTPAAYAAAYNTSASALAGAASLPPNVHLTTVHMLSPTTMLLRLAHVFDAGEDAALSKPVSVDLASLFAGPARIVAAAEMTLPGFKPLADVKPTTYRATDGTTVTLPYVPPPPAGAALTITLDVQDIRTFQCTVAGN